MIYMRINKDKWIIRLKQLKLVVKHAQFLSFACLKLAADIVFCLLFS